MIHRLKEDKGFTLIELIIVIAILAIIATVAIPNIVGAIEDSRKTADIASAKVIADAAARVLAEEGKYAGLVITGTNMNSVDLIFDDTDNDYKDDFEADLYTEINQSVPVPSFKGTSLSVDEANFILVIKPNRTIELYVGNDDDSDANALMIYPNPHTDYN